MNKRYIFFVVLSIICGLLFVNSLKILWPLPNIDLCSNKVKMEGIAIKYLKKQGIKLNGFESVSYLITRKNVLKFLQKNFKSNKVKKYIKFGKDSVTCLPIMYYNIVFKKSGNPGYILVLYHPNFGVIGWKKTMEDDEKGEKLTKKEAFYLIKNKIKSLKFKKISSKMYDFPHRRDFEFEFEKIISNHPEVKLKLNVKISGNIITAYIPKIYIPPYFKRYLRKTSADFETMFNLGIGLMSLGGLIALWNFIIQLQKNNIKLKRSLFLTLFIFSLSFLNILFKQSDIFLYWDPLWSKWQSFFQYIVYNNLGNLWIILILFIFISTGDSIDRKFAINKGKSLWNIFSRNSKNIVKISINGFLTGLICGGIMSFSVIIINRYFSGYTLIQPTGFFFYVLNSSFPQMTSLIFFLMIALVEELGYRYFAGIYLYSLTKRKWVAIIIPAAIYGLGHTVFSFLPPAFPFWGRAFTMFLVGCIWGIIFFKFDILTVIISHFTADLFIFNWPILYSGTMYQKSFSAITIIFPVIFGLFIFFCQKRTNIHNI